MHSKCILFSLTFVFGVSSGQFAETGQDSDYADSGGRTLGSNSGPTLVNPSNQLKGFEPIYVSPDLDDILDRQHFNVYHEEVHGTILMPRLSFGLNDDDQPNKEDDYGDYVNLMNGVDPKFYSRKRQRGGDCGAGCVPRGQSSSVSVFPNPLLNPTIEEMIPYARIRDSPDTYIVMADDPVLAVDSVPKCSKNANKDDDKKEKKSSEAEGGGGEGGEASSAATEGADASSVASSEGTSGETSAATEGNDGSTDGTTAETSSSTEKSAERRKRKRRSVLFDAVFGRK